MTKNKTIKVSKLDETFGYLLNEMIGCEKRNHIYSLEGYYNSAHGYVFGLFHADVISGEEYQELCRQLLDLKFRLEHEMNDRGVWVTY